MKIVYILKKGFQYYPPCYAQLLYLDDIGVELTVYHGDNSDYINKELDARGIRHFTLTSDRESNSRFDSYMGLARYTLEIGKILKSIDSDSVLWFGNCESLLTVGDKIKGRKFVMSVLELYGFGSNYDKLIPRVINDAAAVICCEKHRAAIMKGRYGLKKLPYIMPNKPYDIPVSTDGKASALPRGLEGKFIVIYQGIIGRDRPLDKIAKALSEINDEKIAFAVLGKSDEATEKELKSIYPETYFLGFIPSPQHLNITKSAQIGIANYDDSCLNNIFCAPNKIYEYAAFSIPTLASENLGLSETVGAYGAAECVNFLDVAAIKNGIEKIKSDYKRYSENAKLFYDSTDNRSVIAEIIGNLR